MTDPFLSPFALATAWNARPLDCAERTYEACIDVAAEIQGQAMDFLSSRLAKDSAFIVKLGRCSTPLEIIGAQAEYAGDAFVDFVAEGQKIVASWNAAQQRALGSRLEERAPA